tara:strand:- start:95 stop:271 length:177 start_codon:yes stop_codon:yes gene_type:complete
MNKMQSLEEMVRILVTNDIPHIQARLASLETLGRLTFALVCVVLAAMLAGAVAILVGR